MAICAPPLSLEIFNAHGPYATKAPAPLIKVRQLRDEKAVVIRKYHKPFRDLVLSVDLNGRLGSLTSPHVGDHNADEQDYAGGVFHEILREHSLMVPSTFACCHDATKVTWLQRDGSDRGHRIH